MQQSAELERQLRGQEEEDSVELLIISMDRDVELKKERRCRKCTMIVDSNVS